MKKDKRTKIIISGWYGHGNIGDEAILSAMIQDIKQNIPNSDIVVFSDNPSHTTKMHKVRAVLQHSRRNFLTILKEIIKCNIFILGGGGFLSDWQPEALWLWLKMPYLAKKLGKKVMIYAVGAGPINTDNGKNLVCKIINRFDIITVRDEKSKEWLEKSGVSKEIFVTADPATNLTKENHDESISKLITKSKNKKIALILAPFFDLKIGNNNIKKWHKLKKSYLTLTENIVKKYDIYYFPFQMSRDLELGKYLEKKINKKNYHLIHTINKPNETISFLEKMDLVISFRLHGNIMAAVANTPMIGIIYHHKSYEFLKRINMLDYSLEIGDGSNWKENDLDSDKALKLIDKILSTKNDLKSNLNAKILKLKIDSNNNILLLKDLINSNK